MHTYKIKQDGFKEIKKQTLNRILPIMILAITVGITIGSINSKGKGNNIIVLPITITLAAVTVGFGIYRGLNRQKALLESYQLTLTNNLIAREQFNTPAVSIYYNDIREIIKNKNGSFIIKGKDRTDLIVIPAQIENYSDLENRLFQVKPFATKSSSSFLQQCGILLTILSLALMLCVFTVTNKLIVAFSATILVLVLGWSFYEIRRSKNIDAKAKRSMWWVLVVLASTISVAIIKLL